VKTEKT